MTGWPANTRDEIVHRYVVGRESPKLIGAKYGVSPVDVVIQLVEAGVELRGRSDHAKEWRASVDARAERSRPSTPETEAEEASAWQRADARHVATVTRALAGHGFPLYPAKDLRI